jgi:hypothetical protein
VTTPVRQIERRRAVAELESRGVASGSGVPVVLHRQGRADEPGGVLLRRRPRELPRLLKVVETSAGPAEHRNVEVDYALVEGSANATTTLTPSESSA